MTSSPESPPSGPPPAEIDPEGHPGPRPGHFYRAAWYFYLFLAVAGVLWVGFATGDITLGFFVDTQRWWQDLLIGTIAGLGLILGWWLLRIRLASMRRVEEVMRQMIGPLEGSEIFALAVISGFAEELFFRGAMQSSLGWPLALVIFALLHTGPEPSFRIWTLFAFVAGGLFAWLTLWRGNLLPAVVAHMLVNGVNLFRLIRPLPEASSDEVF